LKRNAVYVRRGSSTAIADPDEVTAMAGHSASRKAVPTIEVEFANPAKRQRLGKSIVALSRRLLDPPPPPKRSKSAYDQILFPHGLNLSAAEPISLRHLQGPFAGPSEEDLRAYAEALHRFSRVGFWIHNASAVTADDVRVQITLAHRGELIIVDEWGRPHRSQTPMDSLRLGNIESDISVAARRGESWEISIDVGKLQPGAEKWTDAGLYIAATQTDEIELRGKLFADNLPWPMDVALAVRTATEDIMYAPAMADTDTCGFASAVADAGSTTGSP
jgi:hypothetical protein